MNILLPSVYIEEEKTSDECVRATGAYFIMCAELFPKRIIHQTMFVTVPLRSHYANEIYDTINLY